MLSERSVPDGMRAISDVGFVRGRLQDWLSWTFAEWVAGKNALSRWASEMYDRCHECVTKHSWFVRGIRGCSFSPPNGPFQESSQPGATPPFH